MQNEPEVLMTLPEVAVRLGVCVATVRRMIDRDALPAKRVGRQYRVPAGPFQTWFDKLDVKPQA